MQQLLRRHAVQLGQRQQIGGAGISRAGLPFADGLTADADALRHKLLRHAAALPVSLQRLCQGFHRRTVFLPYLAAAQVFPQDADQQDQQINAHRAGDKHQQNNQRCPSGTYQHSTRTSSAMFEAIRPKEDVVITFRSFSFDGSIVS